MSDWTTEMINEVEKLNKNTPDGQIVDSDTILVDLIEHNDFEISGLSQDIFNIYKKSKDKDAVKEMFYEFTGINLDEYLMDCNAKISR